MRGGKMKDEGIRFYFYCRGSLPASQKPIIVVPEHVQYVTIAATLSFSH